MNRKRLSHSGPNAPTEHGRLFKPQQEAWHLNAALMHGYGDRWWVYAIGYKRAADILVSEVDSRPRHQDMLVYPILFLYRHYLELTLKNLMRKCWMLFSEDSSDNLDSHDLRRYWQIEQGLIIRVSPETSTEDLRPIARLIDEFCKHDPVSFAFRYPVSKPNSKTRRRSPTLASLRMINIGQVRGSVQRAANLLEGAIAFVDDRLDAKAELSTKVYPSSV
jgi:hypothetical protein